MQTRYLFIGGPITGQWRDVPPAWGPTIKIPAPPDLPRATFHAPADPYEPTQGPEIHTYTLRRAWLPGWVAPLAFYVHESTGGDLWRLVDHFPGWLPRERSTLAGNWMPITHHEKVMWRAIRARGCRP